MKLIYIDMNNIVPILIGLAMCGLFIWSALGLSKIAGQVHGKLDEFMERAKATDDKAQLMLLHSELVQYSNKECWHKHFGNHAREVSAYIRGKLQISR